MSVALRLLYIRLHSKEWNGARPVWSWWTASSSPVRCPASSKISERRPHAGGKYQKGISKDAYIVMSSLHRRPIYPSERKDRKASWPNWHSLTISLRLPREKSIPVDFLYVHKNKICNVSKLILFLNVINLLHSNFSSSNFWERYFIKLLSHLTVTKRTLYSIHFILIIFLRRKVSFYCGIFLHLFSSWLF